MSRYLPLLALLAGVLVAVALATVECVRDDEPEAPSAVEGTPAATATPAATVESVRGADLPFASEGREWARALRVGGTHSPASPEVVVSEEGDLVVAVDAPGAQPGGTWEYPDFRANPTGQPLDFHGGAFDIVLASFDAGGGGRWSRSFGGVGEDYIGDLALTGSGDILLSGTRTEGFDLGAGPVPVEGERHEGWRDGFLARLDADGNPLWVRTFGFEVSSSAGSLAELPSGDIVVVGHTAAQEIQLGDVQVTTERERHSFIVCFSAEGDVEWVTSLDADHAGPIAVDPGTGEIVLGWYERDGEPASTSLRGLMRVSPEGDILWRSEFPVWPNGESGRLTANLLIDSDGTVVLGGTFEGQVDFGGGVLTADAFGSPYVRYPIDGFVARFAPDGAHLMSRVVGDPGEGVGALALDDDGSIIIAGGTYLSRLSPAADEIATVPFPEAEPTFASGAFPPSEEAYARRGTGASRLGTLLVGTPATEEGEVLLGGRFGSRLGFDFGGRILTERVGDAFIARIEAP